MELYTLNEVSKYYERWNIRTREKNINYVIKNLNLKYFYSLIDVTEVQPLVLMKGAEKKIVSRVVIKLEWL